MKMRPDYNKIEYCLGNCFELLSASTVFTVCQDSSDFSNAVIAFVNDTSIVEINGVVVLPRMVGNIRFI